MLRIVVLGVAIVAGTSCARPMKIPIVDAASVADASITAAVKTALLNDPRVDATQVTVRTQAGVVELGGTQPTGEAAAEIVSIVRGVDGVRDVQSSISVAAAAANTDAQR